MKKNRILTLLFAFVTVCGSLSAQSLIVNGYDGTSKSFAINSVKKVLFTGGQVSIYAGETATFPISKVMSIKFGGTTSINSLSVEQGNELSISRNGKYISVNGWEKGRQGTVVVYSTNGQLVEQNKNWDGNVIDLSQLGRGVYILKVGNKSFKITL